MEIALSEMIVGQVYCDGYVDDSLSTYLQYVHEDDIAYWFKEVGGRLNSYIKSDGLVPFGKAGADPFFITPKCSEFQSEHK